MYRVAVCDDEVGTCAQFENVIEEFAQKEGFQAETEGFYSGEALMKSLAEGQHFNLIFLDINLPDISGVEIGRAIRKEMDDERTHIVYVSQEAGYALELFKIRPLDFLVKPVKKEEIEEVLRTSRRLNYQDDQIFMFKQGRQEYFIPYYEILYFFTEGKKISIVCRNPKQDTAYYASMKSLAGKLPEQKFWVIHKSYIVNYSYVVRFAADHVEMLNGDILPISQKHRKSVKEKLMHMREEERL